ncbi:unnamed protein product [Chrysoparadoxa australica]
MARWQDGIYGPSGEIKPSQCILMAGGANPAEGHLPRAPLPPIILSNVPGTWAYDTMSRRVREDILMRVYQENDMDSVELKDAKVALDALIADLATPKESKLRPIAQDGGPEVEEWNTIMAPYLGMNWLDAPWLYTEFYVYRRLMEAFSFFTTGYDPFNSQKQLGVTSALTSMESLASRLLESQKISVEEGLQLYISTALWGNRMDLSLWPVGQEGGDSSNKDVFAGILAQGSANLLADDSSSVIDLLLKAREDGGKRIDIVVDNAGFELYCDMCLADYLVSCGAAKEVVIQMKGHPTFVSDAMAKDLQWMIDHFRGLDCSKYPGSKAVGDRWQGFIDSGKWRLKEDFFWVQPSPFWEMPNALRDELGASSLLVFVKGDANYRRLLGDRTWDLTIPFQDVTSYFPTKLCALRTLKAELGCGMDAEKMAKAAAGDKAWQTNGRFG